MHTALDRRFHLPRHALHRRPGGGRQGDNFLSIIVPQIEASAAYQNNGMIMIWNDETEGGDTHRTTSH